MRPLSCILLLAGCAEPFVPSTDTDLRRPPNADGGATLGGPLTLVMEQDAWLSWESVETARDKWRERKTDPHLLTAKDGQRSLYFAGSPFAAESWSIGRVPVPAAGKPRSSDAEQVLAPRGDKWDRAHLSAPALLSDAEGFKVRGQPFALWYAASGDPSLPDYVTQIGLSTSADGRAFTAEQAPVLGARFNGGQPVQAGPDSHGMTDPSVVLWRGKLHLFYAGLSCEGATCRFQILHRTSADGVNFDAPQVMIPNLKDPKGGPGLNGAAGGAAGPSALVLDDRLYLVYSLLAKAPGPSRAQVQAALRSGTLAAAFGTLDEKDGTISLKETNAVLATPSGQTAAGFSGPSLSADADQNMRLFVGGSQSGQQDQSIFSGAVTR